MPVRLYQAKAEFFGMPGHPVRIRVLELLQDGPQPVRALLTEIDIEPSSLSQQLAALRRSGIVTAAPMAPPSSAHSLAAMPPGWCAPRAGSSPRCSPGRTSCWPSSGNRLPSRPDAEPITASPRQVKPPVFAPSRPARRHPCRASSARDTGPERAPGRRGSPPRGGNRAAITSAHGRPAHARRHGRARGSRPLRAARASIRLAPRPEGRSLLLERLHDR